MSSTNRVTAQATNEMRSQRLKVQNYLVIWVDDTINPEEDDFKNSLTELRAVLGEVEICREPTECIEVLLDLQEGNAFLILSGTLGEHLTPLIHDFQQLYAIYILSGNKAQHEQLVKRWAKIRGIFSSITALCESLKKVAREFDQNHIPMSFIPQQAIAQANSTDKQSLDQLPSSYMYSTIFKQIVLEIHGDDEKQMNNLIVYCRNKNVLESQLTCLHKEYHQKSPVWWYTSNIFLYHMLNRALRTLDMEAMTKLGFFIRHLHHQLQQLHQEQTAILEKQFIVYRGQGFSSQDFQSLYESEGGLLSFNNFLSTTKDLTVAMIFTPNAFGRNDEAIGVLFIITVDCSRISAEKTPFALIDDYSAVPHEQEILFTMHTVFRVTDVKQTTDNDRFYEVQLTMTDDNDSQMMVLTKRLNEEIQGSTGWHRMGKLMLKVGHNNQAAEIYNRLLEDARNDGDRSFIYHMLGMVKDAQTKYQDAVNYYKKVLKIKLKSVPEDDISLAATYSSIGLAYNNMGDYLKALEFHKKSQKIFEKALPKIHPELAQT